MSDEDQGYSASSLEWSYIDPHSRRPTTALFTNEHTAAGSCVIAILNAAKRKAQDGAWATIHNSVSTVRRCAAAISAHGGADGSPEDWADALERLLRNSAISERSRWSEYNRGAPLFKEVARLRRAPFRRNNPFRRGVRHRTDVQFGDELKPLLDRARRDALSIANAFRNPPLDHVPFIEEAREMLVDGLFIPGSVNGARDKVTVRLAERWRQKTGLTLRDLTMYLYPSTHHLIPFFILLTYALAGNVESVALMRRNAPISFVHPAYGPCFELRLDKPRAGEIAPYLVRDAGTLSVGWIIRTVLGMTDSLAQRTSDHNKNLVFLAATNHGNVISFTGHARADAMTSYLSKHNIPATTLKSLRSARGIEEYNRTRDPFRVQRVLNHLDFTQTIEYLNTRETEGGDAVAIADVQRALLSRPNASVRVAKRENSTTLPSHECLKPRGGGMPPDASGLCTHLLWPFNDAHFVLQLEPRPIALLLRDYAGLCEAEKVLSRERFQARYGDLKRLIEDEYLPLVDDALRAEAQKLLPVLAPFPRVEVL
jgi:hypothetical protein